MGSLTQPGNDEPRAAALLALYRAHGPKLYAFAYRLCGSHSLAEDAVQEAFVRAMTSRVAWHSGTTHPDWLLFGFVRNVVREQRRRAQRDVAESAPESSADDTNHDPVGMAVREAMLTLDEGDRAALVLSVYHGYRATEIAHMLGVSAVVVRVRLFRARRRLRSLLDTQPSSAPPCLARGEQK